MPFHHHHKKGLLHPTTYLSSPLLYGIKKEVYFSMNHATKSILIVQGNYDIENMNPFSSVTFPTLCYMIHMTSNYCVEKEDSICIIDFKVKPTYFELRMLHSSYLTIKLGINNNASITMLHTSSHILVIIKLETHILVYYVGILC